MDARTRKLTVKLKDPELAAALVKAGFHNPAKIRAASDKELKEIPGIGSATVTNLRKKLG